MVLLLGFAMPWVQWRGEPLVYAALLLVVIRPLSVFLTVPGRELPKTQRRMVAWFGIRGVGSLFYLALVIDSGLSPRRCAPTWSNATLPAIALSVLLHGVSATPLMALYRRRRVRRTRDDAAARARRGAPRCSAASGAAVRQIGVVDGGRRHLHAGAGAAGGQAAALAFPGLHLLGLGRRLGVEARGVHLVDARSAPRRRR